MSVRNPSDRVDATVTELSDSYGDFPVYEKEYRLPSGGFDNPGDHVSDGVLYGSGILVRRGDEVLLVRNVDTPEIWVEPAGTVEPEETFSEAVHRELDEETGIACEITGIRYALKVHGIPVGDADPVIALLVFFTGEYRDGRATAGGEEVIDVAWHETPPNDLRAAVERRVKNRLT